MDARVRRFVLSLGIACLLWLNALTPKLFAKVQITHHTGRIAYHFEIEGVEESTFNLWGEDFTKVRLKGVEGYEAMKHDPGRPGIPVIRFYVDSPGPITVIPGQQMVELEKAENLVYPFQLSSAKRVNGASPFFFNAQAYDDDEFKPTQAFEVSDAGQVRGTARRLVSLYPYYYKSATGEQKYRREFTVYIDEPNAQATPTLNPSILFIVGKQFAGSAALKAYLEFKRAAGFDVIVEMISDRLQSPMQIRHKIQDWYHTQTKDLRYVILVGDVEDVASYPSTLLDVPKAVTDHYYRAIDTDNYLEDLNGPDVGVGRFSVRDEEELEVLVEKYRSYAASNALSESSWQTKVSFIATDDTDHNVAAEATHDFIIENYTGQKGFLGVFPQQNNIGGDQLYAIKHSASNAELLTAFNNGRSMINYSGHGEVDSWSGPGFTISDLDQLTDAPNSPFVVSYACSTGDITVETSFAEAWQRHPKGAVAFWGSLDSSFWDEDDLLEKNMHANIFLNGERNFANLTNDALEEVWRYYGGEGRSGYYWETYVFLGDPSMDLRIGPPQYVPLVSN